MLFEWHLTVLGGYRLYGVNNQNMYVDVYSGFGGWRVAIYTSLTGLKELIFFTYPSSRLSDVFNEIADLIELYFPGSTIRNRNEL